MTHATLLWPAALHLRSLMPQRIDKGPQPPGHGNDNQLPSCLRTRSRP